MSVRSDLVALVNAVSAVTGRVYADTAPPTAAYPMVTVDAVQDRSIALAGDARTIKWRFYAQVHVWVTQAADDGSVADAVIAAIDGAQVSAPGRRCRVTGAPRIADPEPGLAHYAVQVTVSSS